MTPRAILRVLVRAGVGLTPVAEGLRVTARRGAVTPSLRTAMAAERATILAAIAEPRLRAAFELPERVRLHPELRVALAWLALERERFDAGQAADAERRAAEYVEQGMPRCFALAYATEDVVRAAEAAAPWAAERRTA